MSSPACLSSRRVASRKTRPVLARGRVFSSRALDQVGKETVERGRKPGSVPVVVAFAGWRSFISAALPEAGRATPGATPFDAVPASVWPCSGWGLPCGPCRQVPGALLPHLFTLTHADVGGLFSVALSFGSPRLACASTLPCGARTFLDGPRAPTAIVLSPSAVSLPAADLPHPGEVAHPRRSRLNPAKAACPQPSY